MVLAATSPGHLMVPAHLGIFFAHIESPALLFPEFMRAMASIIYGGSLRTKKLKAKEHASKIKPPASRATTNSGISRIDDYANKSHAWRFKLVRRGGIFVKTFTIKSAEGNKKRYCPPGNIGTSFWPRIRRYRVGKCARSLDVITRPGLLASTGMPRAIH